MGATFVRRPGGRTAQTRRAVTLNRVHGNRTKSNTAMKKPSKAMRQDDEQYQLLFETESGPDVDF